MNVALKPDVSPLPLGRAARALWTLREDASFLNHGSYGAVPRVVQQEQERLRAEMKRHPDAFMARIHPSGTERAPRIVANAVAQRIGTRGERIA